MLQKADSVLLLEEGETVAVQDTYERVLQVVAASIVCCCCCVDSVRLLHSVLIDSMLLLLKRTAVAA